MIKKYIDFIKENNEDTLVPDHFVELKSIAHYLDTNTGELYMDLYDEDEGCPVDECTLEGISEDDMKLIDSYRISTEELVKDKINDYLIDDIISISISEKLVDKRVEIKISTLVRKEPIDNIIALSVPIIDGKPEKKWFKVFKNYADILNKSSKDDFYYVIYFRYEFDKSDTKEYQEEFKNEVRESIELIKRVINEDYPDVTINFQSFFSTKFR
jgi:hypothetical protein